MSIQQDINSALGQVGIIASLNPTLQQKAKNRAEDKAELEKIKKQEKSISEREKVLGDKIDKENEKISGAIASMEKMSPEELKFNEEELHKVIDESANKANAYGWEKVELQDRRDELTRKGYKISPKKFKDRYFELREREVDAELADEVNERAEQTAREKAIAKEKRKQYMSNLYKGVNRTLPGFKDMSREQQESIVKKMSPGDRRKTANEEKWRNEIYGK